MAESTPEQPGRRILVVEDEPGIRDGLDMLLGLEGYAVSTAANGLLALQVLDEMPIDLVITDHMMPRMDGVTFITRLRGDARFRTLPVIMISAVPRPPENLGPLADAFLGKPFEARRLLLLISELLRTGRPAGSADTAAHDA